MRSSQTASLLREVPSESEAEGVEDNSLSQGIGKAPNALPAPPRRSLKMRSSQTASLLREVPSESEAEGVEDNSLSQGIGKAPNALPAPPRRSLK